MKEIKKVKKKRKRYKKIRCFILTVGLILLVAFLLRCGQDKEEPLSEYEERVNAITKIDYSKQQDALNAIVEEGKMNVNYSSEAVFKGAVSEKFNIKNIENNHYPIIFELYDEKEERLYLSKKIEPGYEMSHIQLDKELSKGIHECKLKVSYAEEGNVSSVFPITIEVK